MYKNIENIDDNIEELLLKLVSNESVLINYELITENISKHPTTVLSKLNFLITLLYGIKSQENTLNMKLDKLEDNLMEKANLLEGIKLIDIIEEYEISSLYKLILAIYYEKTENYEKYIEYCDEIIYSEEYKNMPNIYKYRDLNNLLHISIESKGYSSSKEILSKTREYLESIEDNQLKEIERFNFYLNLSQYDLSHNQNHKNKPRRYLKEIKYLYEDNINDKKYIIYKLLSIYTESNILYDFEEYKKSLKLNYKLLEEAKKAKIILFIQRSYQNISRCYEQIGIYDLCIKYFKKYSNLKKRIIKHKDKNYMESLQDKYGYIEEEINIMERKKKELDYKKYTDPLTNIHNRKYLKTLIESNRLEEYKTIFMIDIDYFKIYNDKYGHYNGDIALTKVSETMVKAMTEDMDIVRYGGEEFLILSHIHDINQAEYFGKKLCKDVKDLSMEDITISVGIYTRKDNTISVQEAIKNADRALYEAKNSGRNMCLHYKNLFKGDKINGYFKCGFK